jgi:hypothetical protein
MGSLSERGGKGKRDCQRLARSRLKAPFMKPFKTDPLMGGMRVNDDKTAIDIKKEITRTEPPQVASGRDHPLR